MVNFFFCDCGVGHFKPLEDVVLNITPLLGWDDSLTGMGCCSLGMSEFSRGCLIYTDLRKRKMSIIFIVIERLGGIV